MLRDRRLCRAGAAAELRALADLEINYAGTREHPRDPAQGWHIDSLRHRLAREPPGEPVPGGAWETACALTRDYRFAEPAILRALFHDDAELLGRDMLLEGRFCGLRFDMGVRVTSVIDETRGSGTGAHQVWGWGYQTLQGHLEQGELVYEVVKHLHTGTVDFLIHGYSRRAAIANPLIRTGFQAFGRPTQRRFYRASVRRLHRMVQAQLDGAPLPPLESVPGDHSLVLAPGPEPTRGCRPGPAR